MVADNVTLLKDQSQLIGLMICKNQNNAYNKTGYHQNLEQMKLYPILKKNRVSTFWH